MAQRLARLRRGPQHDLAASFQRLQFLGPLAPQKRLMAIEGGHGRRVGPASTPEARRITPNLVREIRYASLWLATGLLPAQ